MPAPLEMTPEHWQHVLSVYAKHDGHQHAVAEELGWGRKRVQRVWNRGYPSLGFPPVQQVLARDATAAAEIRAERERILRDTEVQERAEQLMAAATQKAPLSDDEQRRIAVMVERENERARARADAVKARGEEAALISASRRNAIALNAVTAQVLRGAVALSSEIQQALEAEAQQPSLSLAQQLGLIRQAAQVARFNAEAGLQAVKSERMVLGDPIVAESADDEQADDLQDASRWIETTMRALHRAKQRGLVATATLSATIAAQPEPQRSREPIEPGTVEVVSPGRHGGMVQLPSAREERERARVRTRAQGRLHLVPGETGGEEHG